MHISPSSYFYRYTEQKFKELFCIIKNATAKIIRVTAPVVINKHRIEIKTIIEKPGEL